MELSKRLNGVSGKEYIIDACIPFVVSHNHLLYSRLETIINDDVVKDTLSGKSPATTTNVNIRLRRVIEILGI